MTHSRGRLFYCSHFYRKVMISLQWVRERERKWMLCCEFFQEKWHSTEIEPLFCAENRKIHCSTSHYSGAAIKDRFSFHFPCFFSRSPGKRWWTWMHAIYLKMDAIMKIQFMKIFHGSVEGEKYFSQLAWNSSVSLLFFFGVCGLNATIERFQETQMHLFSTYSDSLNRDFN